MTATVIIRATATGWQWLDLNNMDAGIQPGLPEITDSGDQQPAKPCILLLPAEQVFLGSAHIVSRNRRQLMQAVPFAVEEQLAEDPESLHFAVHQVDGVDDVQVSAVSRAVLNRYLDELGANGLVAIRAVPDALLLPWRDREISVQLDSGRALVRYGKYSASAIEAELLDSWLSLLIAGMEHRPEKISLYGSDEIDLTLEWPLPCENFTGAYSAASLVAQGLSGLDFNLLQLDYTPQLEQRQTAHWRITSIAAMVAAALAVIVNFSELQTLKSSSIRLEQAIESRFHESFPQVQRLQDPLIQAERELQRLRGGPAFAQSNFINLLSGVAATISARPGLQLTSLRYRNRQMQLELEANSIDELEQLQKVAESAGLDARLQSARLGSEGVSGTLTLTGEPS